MTTLYVPEVMLFGFTGITIAPWLGLISRDQRNNSVLHAHEARHCFQQRRDGVLRFWWRYLTSRDWRRTYEVDACRAGHALDPSVTWRWAHYLANELELFGPTDTPEQRAAAQQAAQRAIEEGPPHA